MSEINRPTKERPDDPDVVAVSAGRATPKRRARGRPRYAAPKEADEDCSDVDVYSIKAFCRRHAISESFFHKLQKMGIGPRTMRLGARTLISAEAAAAWRAERAAVSQEAQI